MKSHTPLSATEQEGSGLFRLRFCAQGDLIPRGVRGYWRRPAVASRTCWRNATIPSSIALRRNRTAASSPGAVATQETTPNWRSDRSNMIACQGSTHIYKSRVPLSIAEPTAFSEGIP